MGAAGGRFVRSTQASSGSATAEEASSADIGRDVRTTHSGPERCPRRHVYRARSLTRTRSSSAASIVVQAKATAPSKIAWSPDGVTVAAANAGW